MRMCRHFPAGGHYYQLTHDYLVHSLRDWLTRKQRETRRGRAELRLAERAAIVERQVGRSLPALRPRGGEHMALDESERMDGSTASDDEPGRSNARDSGGRCGGPARRPPRDRPGHLAQGGRIQSINVFK